MGRVVQNYLDAGVEPTRTPTRIPRLRRRTFSMGNGLLNITANETRPFMDL
jgi:hypothetical protein